MGVYEGRRPGALVLRAAMVAPTRRPSAHKPLEIDNFADNSSGMHDLATVDVERLAGDVGGALGGQEHGHCGDVLRCLPAA